VGLRGVIFGVVIALQLLVPLRALVADSDLQQRFGWSMYSKDREYPAIELALRDGGRREVDFGDVTPRARPEVDYARDLPPHLCSRYPDTRGVLLSFGSREPEVTPCD
jgi:hypothetical protein